MNARRRLWQGALVGVAAAFGALTAGFGGSVVLVTARLAAGAALGLLLWSAVQPDQVAARLPARVRAAAPWIFAAATATEVAARVLLRPLSSPPAPLGAALAAATVVAVLARKHPNSRPALLFALLASALLGASTLGWPADRVSAVTAPLTAAVPAAAVVLALGRDIPGRMRLKLGLLATAGALASLRRGLVLGVENRLSGTVAELLLWSALALVAVVVLAWAPVVRRLPYALLPLALVASSLIAAAPLSTDEQASQPRLSAAESTLPKLASAMTAEAGAGPRPEFRGKDFEFCDRLNSRDCFITVYDDMVKSLGVAAAVEDLVSRVKNNKGATFPAHCHQVAHNLGQMAFELSERFEDAAVLDPQVCGTGYTHGLWEQQFTVLGDDAMFSRTATLCEELNMTTPWYRWTCSHILGHMMVTRSMDDPVAAMELCEKIKEPQAFSDCQAGGWMNFFQDDVVITRFGASKDFKQLFGVCYGATAASKFFCYQELFPVIYRIVDGSDFLAATACLTYAEPARGSGDPWEFNSQNYADRCVQGLARGVAASSFQDYRIMGQRCLSMPDGARSPCLASAASSVVLNTGSTSAAFEVCSLVEELGYREYCYFWSKYARRLLANGPNNQNLPDPGEIRLPESTYSPPGAPVVRFETAADEGS